MSVILMRSLPLPCSRSRQQVVQALEQVLAAGLGGLAQHLGVGQHEVRRRTSRRRIAANRNRLSARSWRPARRHASPRPARSARVSRYDCLMKSKTSLSFQASSLKRRSLDGGVDHRLGLHPHHAARGVLPQRHVVLPEARTAPASVWAGLAISRAVISMNALPMFSGSASCSSFGMALQPFGDDALRPLGDIGHGVPKHGRVGQS